jgi:hypothetical protein
MRGCQTGETGLTCTSGKPEKPAYHYSVLHRKNRFDTAMSSTHLSLRFGDGWSRGNKCCAGETGLSLLNVMPEKPGEHFWQWPLDTSCSN